MSFFGLNFGQNADIDIILDDQENRRMADIRDENGRKERLYLYYDGESVSGKVNVTLHRKTSRLEHQGIKIEFIGQIELYYDRGNHHEFLSLVKELARPGDLTQNTAFDFEFSQVEKPYECYTGANVRLRYFLRVTIVRRLTDMVKELDILVHTLATYPEMNNPIKMEVGIEECLHIEFEYNKSKYHLKDVIVGKIYFLLVRIKIKHMEVAIIKRETTGSGPNTFHDNETIAKYEIMDGAPVKGESIPIRVFLAGYDLTPTMRDINKKFSVRYYLNLVLVDEEERRYFKQQEITLWRKAERPRKPYSLTGNNSNAGPLPNQHAMARHQGGQYPSQNIRTAPTPSNPNTPIVSERSSFGQFDEGDQHFTREDDGQNVDREMGNASPQQMTREDDDNSSEPEIVNHEDVKQDVVEPSSAKPIAVAEEITHIQPQTKPELAPKPVSPQPQSLKQEPVAKQDPVASDETKLAEDMMAKAQIAESPKIETATSPKVSTSPKKAASKTSRPDEDDDDRPKPPEDDSVPDEDSIVEGVHSEEGDSLGNDDL